MEEKRGSQNGSQEGGGGRRVGDGGRRNRYTQRFY